MLTYNLVWQGSPPTGSTAHWEKGGDPGSETQGDWEAGMAAVCVCAVRRQPRVLRLDAPKAVGWQLNSNIPSPQYLPLSDVLKERGP